MKTKRPTQEEIQAAANKTVPNVIAPGLKVLFCGINPGLYTAAVGHHFARPGNRFWPALYQAGITPHQFDPAEERQLLDLGYGITNVVPRATTGAADLTRAELVEGGRQLAERVREYHPKVLAVLGLGAYRAAFGHPEAQVGLQDEQIGPARVWVLPNPSGLNAHYSLSDLAGLLRELHEWVNQEQTS